MNFVCGEKFSFRLMYHSSFSGLPRKFQMPKGRAERAAHDSLIFSTPKGQNPRIHQAWSQVAVLFEEILVMTS